MTIASELTELRDIIHRKFEASGMRSTKANLMHDVDAEIPEHIVAYLAAQGLEKSVAKYLNRHIADGLPFAPEVNDKGEHAPLVLCGFEEFEYVAAAYVKRGKANFDQAKKVAAQALDQHGKSIVIDGVDLSATKAA